MSVDLLIARLAAKQNSVVSRRQLRDIPLSESAIAHRIATGRLHRFHRGVYLVGSPAPPPLALETGALFACGTGAVLSHYTAARLQRLIDRTEPRIEVTLVDRHCRVSSGILVHRTRRLPRHDVRRHERLPVTAPLRTILDLASTAERGELERVVNEAQVLRLLTLNQLGRRLAKERGRAGVGALCRIVEAQHQPQATRSDVEKVFLQLVDRAGLPAPRADYPIGRYRADFAWPDQHLVAELDSVAFHATQPKFVGDRRRWADIDALGWRLFRFTWWDVMEEPEAMLVRLTRSLIRDAA